MHSFNFTFLSYCSPYFSSSQFAKRYQEINEEKQMAQLSIADSAASLSFRFLWQIFPISYIFKIFTIEETQEYIIYIIKNATYNVADAKNVAMTYDVANTYNIASTIDVTSTKEILSTYTVRSNYDVASTQTDVASTLGIAYTYHIASTQVVASTDDVASIIDVAITNNVASYVKALFCAGIA